MKNWSPLFSTGRSKQLQPGRILAVLLFALILSAAGLFAASTQRAAADAGPWPTSTPTRTPLPTFPPLPTLTPTLPLLPTFVPTNTPIPLGPVLEFPTATLPAPTPVPASSSFSALLCWPFAIAFIVIAILVSNVFLSRRGP